MTTSRPLVFALMASVTLAGCWKSGYASDVDAATDTDTDGDTDNDTDTDTDSDTECFPESYLGCGADGDVHWFDSCDVEGEEVSDCLDEAANGACADGVCGCAPGHTGDDCARCLIYVVGAGGSDSNEGDSCEEGLATVQAGINTAAPEGCEVWVKEGVHKPTEDPTGSSTPSNERTKTILLKEGVDLYGGFDGAEIALSQQNVTWNETTLSGDIGTIGDGSENCYHVVTGADFARIDGFTITAGTASLDCWDSPDSGGGGMNNDHASPTVSNCVLTGNGAAFGGGMLNFASSPTVTNCNFANNIAYYGGGMANYADSSPVVADCTFSNNTGYSEGAGMSNNSSSPTVTSCLFQGNTDSTWGGVGSGMSNNALSSPVVTSCTFLNNATSSYGGGMFNGESSSTVTGCVFAGNSALKGGGLYDGASSSVVANCIFVDNYADYGGAGVYNYWSFPSITNCTFTDNRAQEVGGGLYNDENSSPTVTNCIFWGDIADVAPEIANGDSSTATVTYSDAQGGCSIASGCTTDGTGNIDADPLFVDAASGDLHLRPTSPCIDTGNTDALPPDTENLDDDSDVLEDIPFDLDGNPRVVDGGVDMGAYEYQP
jgi:hypothetical protein